MLIVSHGMVKDLFAVADDGRVILIIDQRNGRVHLERLVPVRQKDDDMPGIHLPHLVLIRFLGLIDGSRLVAGIALKGRRTIGERDAPEQVRVEGGEIDIPQPSCENTA